MAKRPDVTLNSDESRSVLVDGACALNISLDDEQIGRYLHYAALLQKWNRQINLTSIDNIHDIMVLHVLDCLAALPYASGTSVACIGSGGGTPGLIWAIARPELNVTLVEPRSKRAQFLRYASAQLGLKNTTTANERAERFNPPLKFDTLTCRALGSLSDFYKMSRHLATDDTRWVALKGKLNQSEMDDAIVTSEQNKLQIDAHVMTIPFLEAERHVIVMRY